MCGVTHHEPFGLGLTSVHKFCRPIVFILDDIIIFLHRWLYNILCVVLIFHQKPGGKRKLMECIIMLKKRNEILSHQNPGGKRKL